MKPIRCILGIHDWSRRDHYPEGDSISTAFKARRCLRCKCHQWATTLYENDWKPGLPPRRPNKPPPPQAPRGGSGTVAGQTPPQVVAEQPEIGLTPQEQGTP